ncbi:putative fluoride ion transporter CrcB [Gammaproteobacteria bacterium]
MGRILLVGLGGSIGSVLRYAVADYVQQTTRGAEFPYGTLTVNVVGCFVIGFLSQLVDMRGILTAEVRAFFFVGVLGGFTTFSSFGNESMNLFRAGEDVLAFANVGAHVLFGLGAVWLGRIVVHMVYR